MRVALLCDYPIGDNYKNMNIEKRDEILPTPTINLVNGYKARKDIEVIIITFKSGLSKDYEIVDENIKILYLRAPKFSGIATLYTYRVCKIKRILKVLKPDIVHGQGTEREMALAAVLSGLPHVITIHGMLFEVLKITKPRFNKSIWLNLVIEKYVLKKVKNIICISKYCAENIKNKSNAKLFYINNAISNKYFEYSKNIRNDFENNILVIGSVYPLKSVLESVMIFKRVNERVPNSKLIIIGKILGGEQSEYYQSIQTYISDNNLKDKVTFEGWKSEDEIIDYMLKSKILLFPSKAENAPMSIVEAMAMGVITVGSAVGDIPNMIRESGISIKELDIEEYEKNVIKILENKELYNKLITKCKEVSSLYSIDEISDKTIECYRNIIGGR